MPLTGYALCLLTALGSAAPARAAGDLAKMEAEFAARAERAAAVLDEMKAVRTAFPDSGGKAAAVDRMAALVAEFDEFWRWEEELIGAHSQTLVGMRVHAISIGLDGAARGEGPSGGDSRRLRAFEDADIAMRRRAERLVGAYKDESGAFGPMRGWPRGRSPSS
ncbi:MAG: hypothetical protein HYV15_02185 [Elusimicrobia bacterium]|nr:hypothetical protein [Elusimicrobiota bacterium]